MEGPLKSEMFNMKKGRGGIHLFSLFVLLPSFDGVDDVSSLRRIFFRPSAHQIWNVGGFLFSTPIWTSQTYCSKLWLAKMKTKNSFVFNPTPGRVGLKNRRIIRNFSPCWNLEKILQARFRMKLRNYACNFSVKTGSNGNQLSHGDYITLQITTAFVISHCHQHPI
jgi:hypothetical protein